MAAKPADALQTLVRLLPEVLRIGWAIVVQVDGDGRGTTLASGGGAPEVDGLAAPLEGLARAIRLDGAAPWVPTDWQLVATELAAAPMPGGRAVLVGRPGGPAMRDIELARLGHLTGLAASVAARSR